MLGFAGLPQEAAGALAEAGLWRYAAVLVAARLRGDERAALLERWATHIDQVQSRVWAKIRTYCLGCFHHACCKFLIMCLSATWLVIGCSNNSLACLTAGLAN